MFACCLRQKQMSLVWVWAAKLRCTLMFEARPRFGTCVWHLQRSVKCVGSVRWSRRSGFGAAPWLQPIRHRKGLLGALTFDMLWREQSGLLLCDSFVVVFHRDPAEEPVLCLSVRTGDRSRLLCSLSYVQYAAVIMMDCPVSAHLWTLRAPFILSA